MPRIFLILVSLLLVSCGGATKESPVIYFSNASQSPISKIKCNWAGNNELSLPTLNPGDSRSQSFYIKKDADFFGTINISWSNDKGEKVVKEFNFREKHLPSMGDTTTYNYVQLYFDQEDIDVVSSDSADLSGKTRRMDRLLTQYRDAYAQGHTTPQTSLISVQPKKDSSLPIWLSTSY